MGERVKSLAWASELKMIKYLQKGLGKLGEFETKHFITVLIFVLLLTGVSLVGMTQLTIESDFSKFDPKGIPAIELSKKLGKEFSSFSSIIVIVELDDKSDIGKQITDIRDPEVIEFLVRLENNLKTEKKVDSVFSAGTFFQQGVPQDIGTVKAVLSQIPQSSQLFDKSYTFTPLFITADVGADSEKVEEIDARIKEIIAESGTPAGVKTIVTGEPSLFSAIFNLILGDAFFTLIIASIIIFLLLLIIKRSFRQALIIITPVLLGILWTSGALGWLNIPITIATAAMGAMLLGLGIEYSIFLNSRYLEERADLPVDKALIKALSTTGASTVSSGITTIIGFFALTLSIFPMLSDLGKTLAIGIFFVLFSTMVTGPLIVILEEKLEKLWGIKRKTKKKETVPRTEKVFEKYGSFVANRPVLVAILALLVTGFLFTGVSQIKNEEIDFDTILPSDLPELVAFQTLEGEFQETFQVKIFVELSPTYSDSNEPVDIRDPRVINYIDILSEKAKQLDYIDSVSSISTLEGRIPQSLSEQKQLISQLNYQEFITSDFSGTIIKINFREEGRAEELELIRQVYELVETTEKPVGVSATPSGGIITNFETNKIIGPDSSTTALIAFALIVVFLFLLSRSIKYTVLPLVTVIVAIVWILGLIGYLQIPFNSIISSVISMTIGIGIDFGIQLSVRFRQEQETNDKRTAMKQTLKYTLYPMVITVIAALIGFQSMSLGQLKLMQSLGNTLSIGIASSMIVAVTLVASLMVILQIKDNKTTNKSQQNLKTSKSK